MSETTPKQYRLGNVKQLIDLNGNSTNFECEFEVMSHDGSAFQVVVADQDTIDSTANLPYEEASGSIAGRFVKNEGIQKSHYLVLKADNPCEATVTIKKKELPISEGPPAGLSDASAPRVPGLPMPPRSAIPQNMNPQHGMPPQSGMPHPGMPHQGGMSHPGMPHQGGMSHPGMPQGPTGIPPNAIPPQAIPPGMQHPGLQNGQGVRAQPRGQSVEPLETSTGNTKNNQWFKWVIIGGVILILAVGGFMAWRWYSRKQKKSKDTTIGSVSNKALPPPPTSGPSTQLVPQLNNDGGISDSPSASAIQQSQNTIVDPGIAKTSTPLDVPIAQLSVPSVAPPQSSSSDLLERLKQIS